MAKTLKWKVGEVPTGRYRSFEKRWWPDACYAGTELPAAQIYCKDDYEPKKAKTGDHSELEVRIACWYWIENENPLRQSFRWRSLKQRFATLQEAKDAAESFVSNHKEIWPAKLTKT